MWLPIPSLLPKAWHGISALRIASRGVATIELALILPVVTVIMIGLLDIGVLAHREMDLRNAARVGVQYAFQDTAGLSTIAAAAVEALGPQPTGAPAATATAISYCECPTSTTDYSVTTEVACTTATCPVTGTKPATYVQVSMQQAYTPLFGSWGIIGSRTMTATATLRVN